MKKWIFLLLGLVLVANLVFAGIGCKGKEEPPKPAETPAPPAAAPTPAPAAPEGTPAPGAPAATPGPAAPAGTTK